MFNLTIKTGNAAFCEADGERSEAALGTELARILNAIAENLACGACPGDFGTASDANGNTVGNWELTA